VSFVDIKNVQVKLIYISIFFDKAYFECFFFIKELKLEPLEKANIVSPSESETTTENMVCYYYYY